MAFYVTKKLEEDTQRNFIWLSDLTNGLDPLYIN